MKELRTNLAVARVLDVFLEDVSKELYGYLVMKSTGFPSGKVYELFTRLRKAGWIERLDDPSADPASGGPPRITYRLVPDAVPMARRLVNDARAELGAPARRWAAGLQPEGA